MTTVTEVSGAWRVGAGVRSEDSVRGCEEAGPGSEEGGWSKGRQGQAGTMPKEGALLGRGFGRQKSL